MSTRLKWQYQQRPDLNPWPVHKTFDSRYGFSESGKRCWECMFCRGSHEVGNGHCIIGKVWPIHKRCYWFKDKI